MTLFDEGQVLAPLAVRMRPISIDDVVGQEAALSPGTPLRNLLTGSGSAISIILWGPPGTGKTTLATLVSLVSGHAFAQLSAVTSGVKELREVIEAARNRSSINGQGTVLFVDEVHRFSKSQQDALLPAVENGWVTLIAATTENPSFSVISPLLSRSLVVTLQPLTDQAIATLLHRALQDERGFNAEYEIAEDALADLIHLSLGDARRSLTALEAAVIAAQADESKKILLCHVEQAVQHVALRYDKDGDQHYDVISAFIKSVRGSDPDAALHYLARMLEAGEDPRFVARRLMILASEDIGMADSQVLQTAVAAATSVAIVGMPEAQIILAHATVHAALAPKSNAIVSAIMEARRDVQRGRVGTVPIWLRDAHYPGAETHGHGQGYIYPHDLPDAVAAQSYLPEQLAGVKYYRPTQHGAEAAWGRVAERLEQLRNGDH